MRLTPGHLLGPYEILQAIGAGGMGEVYRARDTRIGRDVAVKISGGRFTERFEREARAIASLNHAHICTLFDVGPDYLVMELVEGPTLAERLKQGPIPVAEALGIGKQIAEALDAAHGKGIVHRDLKPGNIKIRPDGSLKVLDFGLAKVASLAGAHSDDSPTFSMSMTEAGILLGTAAYMSPEQARGYEVDKRTDIWAFGAVLYELLAGKPAFEGQTVSDILAAVLTKEPDWTALPRGIPLQLLRRCLEKDPKRRLRDIGDAVVEPDAASAPPLAQRAAGWQLVVMLLALLVAAASFAALLFWKRGATPENTVSRLVIRFHATRN